MTLTEIRELPQDMVGGDIRNIVCAFEAWFAHAMERDYDWKRKLDAMMFMWWVKGARAELGPTTRGGRLANSIHLAWSAGYAYYLGTITYKSVPYPCSTCEGAGTKVAADRIAKERGK